MCRATRFPCYVKRAGLSSTNGFERVGLRRIVILMLGITQSGIIQQRLDLRQCRHLYQRLPNARRAMHTLKIVSQKSAELFAADKLPLYLNLKAGMGTRRLDTFLEGRFWGQRSGLQVHADTRRDRP